VILDGRGHLWAKGTYHAVHMSVTSGHVVALVVWKVTVVWTSKHVGVESGCVSFVVRSSAVYLVL